MAGHNIPDAFVPIHNEVFALLTYQWPYSLAAGRVAWYIARWSWGWKRGRMTPWPLDTGKMADEIPLNRRVIQRELRTLQADGIIIRDPKGRAGIDKWALKRKAYHMVPQKRTIRYPQSYHMVPSDGQNPKAHNTQQRLTDSIQTTDKEPSRQKPGRKVNSDKSICQIDNDRQVESVLLAWKQATGSMPVTGRCRNPYKLAQKALKRCRALDLSWFVVIARLAGAQDPWRYFMSITKPGGTARIQPEGTRVSFADALHQLVPETPVTATAVARTGKPEAMADILARMATNGAQDNGQTESN